MRFTGGIDFDFSTGSVTSLAPGETVVVVENEAAFIARYGNGILIAGKYANDLSNGGDHVVLVDDNDQTIHDFTYSDDAPWPTIADGGGPSLEVFDVDGDYGSSINWRSSAASNGTPGVQTVSQLADYNRDSLVDAADYATWRSAYGSTTELAADGNGDNVVDAADYTVWRDSLAAAPQPAAAASSAGDQTGQAADRVKVTWEKRLQGSSADLYVISDSEVTMQGGAVLFAQDLANGRKSLTTPRRAPSLSCHNTRRCGTPRSTTPGQRSATGYLPWSRSRRPAKLELSPEDASQQREHQLALDIVLSEFSLDDSLAEFLDEE